MTDAHVHSPPLLPEELPNQAPRIAVDRRLADQLLSADMHPERDNERGPRPYPTALFRVLAVGGMAVLAGVMGVATYEALRDSDWEQSRPLLDMSAAVAAMVMVGSGMLWAVFAALNARKAGLRNTVHPMVVPLVTVLQVAGWFGVDRLVTGDQRRTAWAIWLAGALLAHLLAALMYRTTAAMLGDTYEQFSLVAWLPLFGAAVAVTSTYTPGAVFGLPMVGALAAWLAVEGYLAMAGWDRECRVRITGVDPTLKPLAAEYEDAVAKAAGRTGPATPERTTFHHTMVPRAMVLASLVLGLTLPAWVILLEYKGHVQVSGIDTKVDIEAARVLTGLAAGSIVAYALGWMWWSVAAALNAAHSSRWSVPAWSAPLGYAVSATTIGTVVVVQQHVNDDTATVIAIAGGLVVAAAHFVVLRGYRRTAEAMGGSAAAWTRVIVIPIIAAGVSVLAAFLSRGLGDVVFERAMQASWVLFYGLYAISHYVAMASFDRACRGTVLTNVRFSGVPDFLKRRREDADTTT